MHLLLPNRQPPDFKRRRICSHFLVLATNGRVSKWDCRHSSLVSCSIPRDKGAFGNDNLNFIFQHFCLRTILVRKIELAQSGVPTLWAAIMGPSSWLLRRSIQFLSLSPRSFRTSDPLLLSRCTTVVVYGLGTQVPDSYVDSLQCLYPSFKAPRKRERP